MAARMEVLGIVGASVGVRRRRAIDRLPGILQEHPTPSLAALRQLWKQLRPEELCESSVASPGPRPPNTVTVDELRRASPPELPHALGRFLEQWRPWMTGAPLRAVHREDALWDSIPLILQSGRTYGYRRSFSAEAALQFVTFWHHSGAVAHPAVDAELVDASLARVRRRGQSVRSACSSKPATWITRLTLAGFFREIDLLNLVKGPSSLMDPRGLPYAPRACLESFTVARGPRPG